MVTGWVDERIFGTLLGALTEDNAFALQLMMATGMRISDCLGLRWSQIPASLDGERCLTWEYQEQKTKKLRTVTAGSYLSAILLRRRAAGEWYSDWVFPGRDREKHRTRQAVWKDLHRAAKLFRVNGKRLNASLGTHTARKIYAVRLYQQAKRTGENEPLDVVMRDLNHSDRSVTYLYALADEITARNGAENRG